MGYVVVFIIGLVVGGALVRIWSYFTSVGSLRVDNSIPDEPPYIFLELKEDVKKLCKMQQVTLQVHIKDFIPRK